MGMDFLPVRRSDIETLLTRLPDIPAHSAEEPLFYRDAMGGTEISSVPKTDSMKMDFLPVRASQIAGLLPPIGDAPHDQGQKRILFYRNPMGLPDTSPVPKKDSMGMDYRPVYEGDDGDDGIVKVAPGKIQRTGVRSEPAQHKPVVSTIRVPGSIQLDERRLRLSRRAARPSSRRSPTHDRRSDQEGADASASIFAGDHRRGGAIRFRGHSRRTFHERPPEPGGA